ncbi:MAG: hypothetical protein LBT05_13270 [Planctomycetaceae bacterium]|jgi:hypothetical protein|nr:hypothetical protein [Planctomycetaceae bacterium]
MKNNSLFLLLLAISWMIFTLDRGLIVAEDNDDSRRFEEFSKFSETQKKKIIIQSFEDRMKKAENIYYKLDLMVGTSKNKQGVPDNQVDFFGKRNYARRQLGKSYKVDMEMFKGIASQPIEWVTSAYNVKKGESRGLFHSILTKNNKFGLIDTRQDVAATDDIYLLWLQDSFFLESSIDRNSHIFVYLLEHKDDWKFFATEKENQIGLEVKFEPDYAFNFSSYDGTLKVILNFTKGFMPESSEIRWNAVWKNNNHDKFWRNEKFLVEKSVKIDDIWTPTQLTRILGSSIVPDVFTISKANIHEIEYGKVTPNDITLIFSENTAVTDAINDISYKTDANGEPIKSTIEPLYGFDPSKIQMPEEQPNRTNYILTVLGLAMMSYAAYLQIKKRRNGF